MNRRVRAAAYLSILLAPAAAGSPQPPAASPPDATELADRVLAVVDEDPILESELDQIVGLGLVERGQDEGEEEFRRRLLDQLIDQKLRFHEIDRYGFAQVPLEEVDDQFGALRDRLGGAAAMKRKLAELGLDETGVRQLLARQLMVLTFVEERLGPRVLIGLEDTQKYYDDVLVPEMRSRGQSVPPVAEVREQIRQLLREQRLNEEIERWTDELRLEADIEDYFDSEHDELPTRVLERIEE